MFSHFNGERLDYRKAADYLEKARNKWDRPLHGKANARIIWMGDGKYGTDSIALRLHETICVVLHPDDTYSINTGGWNTQTTRAFLNNYSPARIWNKSNRLYISDKNDTVTPPRVWKCRTCSGQGYTESTYTWDYVGSKYVSLEVPRVVRNECYRCKSTGSTDYGSQPVYTDWSGSWARVDSDGNLIACEQYVTYHAAQKSMPTKYKPYGSKLAGWPSFESLPEAQPAAKSHDVSTTLNTILPGLKEEVRCPAYTGTDYLCHGRPGTVESTVIHLNDDHKWTRETIADWLDTLDVDLSFPSAA